MLPCAVFIVERKKLGFAPELLNNKQLLLALLDILL